jgi:hypothetical protein
MSMITGLLYCMTKYMDTYRTRQHNGQEKKDKRTNNDLQNMTNKTKDRVTRTPLKPGVNSGTRKGKRSLLH